MSEDPDDTDDENEDPIEPSTTPQSEEPRTVRDLYQMTPAEIDALDSEVIDRLSEESDTPIRILEGPDTDRWATILDVPEFRTPLLDLDGLFEPYDYPVELHVERHSFKQVEYDNQPKPDRLTLVIANDYETVMETIHHPFFRSMDRDAFRQPTDTNIALGFGGYDETIEIPTTFEYVTVHVPTFRSYGDSVIRAFADRHLNE